MDGVYALTMYGGSTAEDGGPMYLRNNDNVLCRTWITGGGGLFTTGMCTAVAELVVGDSVRVTGGSGDPAIIAGEASGFAGFIIS